MPPNNISKDFFKSMDDAIMMLTEGIVDIYFIKKTDGNIRHMHCTLNPKFMPNGTEDTLSKILSNALSEGSISLPLPVWDFVANGWRSFYLTSTIDIKPSPIFGDTTTIVEDIVDEYTPGDESISNEITEEMVESVGDMLKQKLSKVIKESPDKIIDFSTNKIKVMALNILQKVISGKRI
tara:strand:- start:158 stop:697 length:540 start_codon:yes stop_codon:yes gene_type:complete